MEAFAPILRDFRAPPMALSQNGKTKNSIHGYDPWKVTAVTGEIRKEEYVCIEMVLFEGISMH